jgi:hypothetical protein
MCRYNFERNEGMKGGLFHKWIEYREDLKHTGTWALIEIDNGPFEGQMELAHYTCVRFID